MPQALRDGTPVLPDQRAGAVQRWLLPALAIAFAWVVFSRLAEIKAFLGTLEQGSWPWIAAAAGLQLVAYLALSTLYQAALGLVDLWVPLRELIPLTFVSIFVNTTTPSGGTAGLAVFVAHVRQRGEAAARAAAGTLLVQAILYGVFGLVLSLGLVILAANNDLTFLELASALLLFLLVGGLGLVLMLAYWRPAWLRWLLNGVQQVIQRAGNRLRRSPLPPTWAAHQADEFVAAATAVALHPARLGRALLLAAAVHLANVASLFCLFLAFSQTATPERLITGYAMSVLFMIISPTPNGVGVVESVLPVIYRSLGMSAEAGTAVTLAFRGLSFWLPMFIGFLLLRQLKMFGGAPRALAEVGQVRLIAVLTGIMGFLNVLSAWQPALMAPVAPLTRLSPLRIQQGGAITAALAGFGLLLLAHGLWRTKRAAWWLTLAALLFSVGAHLVNLDLAEAGLAAILAVYLLAQRNHFQARSDAPSVGQGLQVLAAALAFTLAFGAAGFYLLDRAAGVAFSLRQALTRSLNLFLAADQPILQPTTGYELLADIIFVVGVTTLGYALLMLLRPVLVHKPTPATERQRAARIVAAARYPPLAFRALQPGSAFYFSQNGSVLPYYLRGRTALALGGPAGPEGDQAAAVTAFIAFCRQRDWQPAFYRLEKSELPLFAACGLQTAPVGHEAIVPLPAAATDSYPHVRARVIPPPLSGELMDRLRLVSDAWLALRGQGESKLGLTWDHAAARQQPVAVVESAAGDFWAFATLILIPQQGMVVVDQLRHRQRLPPQGILALRQALASWGQAQGYGCLHLGLSPSERQPLRPRRWPLAPSRPVGRDRRLELLDGPGLTWQASFLAYAGQMGLSAVWAAVSELERYQM